MNIGIIGAMESEVASLIALLSNHFIKNIHGLEYHTGTYKNHNLVVTKSGVGKVNMAICATLLFTNFDCDFVINTGIAGSVDTKINSVVLVDEVGYSDIKNLQEGHFLYDRINLKSDIFNKVKSILGDSVIAGSCLTADKFIVSIDDVNNNDLTNVKALDMESMSLAVCARRFNKDLIIIRAISDNLCLKSADDNEFHAANVAIEMVKNLLNNLL